LGNIARHLVGFAMLPIYTRFLSPADYGVIALLTFALALFEPVFGARLSMALPKFYLEVSDERRKRAVIWTALGLTGSVSAISVSALFIFRGLGSEALFGDQRYALVFGIFAVNLLTRPLEDTGMMYLRIHERSRLFLTMSMMKLTLQLALNVVLVVYLQEGVIGAVLSGVISSVTIGGCLTTYIINHEAPAFDLQLMRKMLQFSWPLWISGFGSLYVGSSGGVFLRILGSLSDVGRLELALKFATAVSMLIWSPFAQQWTPMSYRIYREGNGEQRFQVAFVGMSAAMFIGGLGIAIFAKPAIGLMAARDFYPAAAAVPLLTLGFIFNELRSFFNFSFLVTDNTKVSSLCQYVMAAAITIAYWMLIPRYGLMGAAEAQCAAFLVGLIYSRVLSRRYFDPGMALKPVVLISLISVAACVVSIAALPEQTLSVGLIDRSAIYIAATGLIAVVAVRAIADVDEALLSELPRPLVFLARLALERQHER
jgi:O-antigen/teichoic acid export membrane protein